jgi:hypothetical protein
VIRVDHVPAIRARFTSPATFAAGLGWKVDKGQPQSNGGVFVWCPQDGDKRASLSITCGPDGTVRGHCFSCDESWNAFGLIALAHRLDVRRDFREGVLPIAASMVGYDLGASFVPPPIPTPREAPPEPEPPPAVDLTSTIASVVLPLDHPDAADVAAYLEARGLTAEADLDNWGALDLVELRYQIAERISMGGEPTDLERAGLVWRQDDGWCVRYPQHLLVMPWWAADGSVHTVQRRRIDACEERKYVFPKGPGPRWPYGVDWSALWTQDEPVVFVEGAVDTLARRELDFRDGLNRTVLGVPGTGNWKPEWAEFARGRVAFIATDADDAGDKVVERWAADLYAAGAPDVKRLRPTKASDWAGCLS